MSKKLLLADDSITIQKVIGITFANEDYALSVVDNGNAALEKARAQRPDLILADVFMPGKNGYELCAAIKADPTLQQIPVLLLAGTFEPFDEAKARKAGADGWIAKPFESQTLIDRVEDLLARPRPVAAAPAGAAVVADVPSGVAAAPAALDVAAGEEEDAEPDLWAELGPLEAPILDAAEPATAPLSDPLAEPLSSEGGDDAGGIDDLWGEVSLGEEDLAPMAPAAAGKDIWGDLDSAAATATAATAESPALTADDLWDDLAVPADPDPVVAATQSGELEEEEEVFLTLEDEEESLDLLDPVAEDGEEEEAFVFVEDDELAEDLSAAAAQPDEAATTFVAAEPAEEALLELDEVDIMPLDEADILEEELELLEEPLDLVEEDFAPAKAVESAESEVSFADLGLADLPLAAEDGLELTDEAATTAEPAMTVLEETMALEESFDGLVPGDLSPLAEAPQGLVPDQPESLLVESQMEEEPLWDVVEPAMAETATPGMEELIELEPEVAAAAAPAPPPITPVAPAPTAQAVAAQVQSLSEAELSRIVERVAADVIERLAGTILERMAWEVVPDLAETLIREEIRKIRDNVA